MTPRTRFVVVSLLIAVAGLSPLLCALGAGQIAEANGCRFDEAGAYPCVILGRDYGELLATFGVLGWASLVTFPAALLLLGVWGAWNLVVRQRRRASGPPLPKR